MMRYLNKIDAVSLMHIGEGFYIFLVLLVIITYMRALSIMLWHLPGAQKGAGKFTLKGWLGVFSNDADYSGQYILRLALSGAALMLALNFAHLLIFVGHVVLQLEDVAWRFAHIVVSSLMIFIAKHYKALAERQENG